MIWAVVGTPPNVLALFALAAWATSTAALAGAARRRDDVRRFDPADASVDTVVATHETPKRS